MPKRTQIVCLHEGEKGRSIDPVFIGALLKALRSDWMRPGAGGNLARMVGCGGRTSLIERMPDELRACISTGGDTTLMVWADMDHDIANGDQLREAFWARAQRDGVTRDQFDRVVFIFAKDRIENWIEFLNTGSTDESKEGSRVKHGREAADAAKLLAKRCGQQPGAGSPSPPPSLAWSCENWRGLVRRMGD